MLQEKESQFSPGEACTWPSLGKSWDLTGHCENGPQWTRAPLQWDIAAPPIKSPSLKSVSPHHLDLSWPSDLLWPLEYGGCDGVWFLSLGLKGLGNLLEPWGCHAVRKPKLTGGGEPEKQEACWSGRLGGTSLAVTADGGSEQGRGKATGQLGICQRSQKAAKVKWKVKVAQSCPTLCNPMDYIVHGILQARILEWVAFPFSRGSSQPRDWTQVSCNAGGFFTIWTTRKPKNTGVGSLSLLQWIFPNQELNQGLLQCRQILYQLSYQESGSPQMRRNGLGANGEKVNVVWTEDPISQNTASRQSLL